MHPTTLKTHQFQSSAHNAGAAMATNDDILRPNLGVISVKSMAYGNIGGRK